MRPPDEPLPDPDNDTSRADYRDDHPEAAEENAWELGLDKVVQAGFSSVTSVKWGGTTGFQSACIQVGDMMTSECTAEKTACKRKADKKTSCRRYGQRGGR